VQLCATVPQYLRGNDITAETVGIEALYHATRQLAHDLAALFVPLQDQ